MNNKKKILVTIVITFIIIFTGVTMMITKKSDDNGQDVKNSSITDKGYYIENGIDAKLADTVKAAAESYLNQSKTESAQDRTNRLKKHFSSNSPVYEYEQNNIYTSVNKSKSEVNSISLWPMEGDGKLFIVLVDTKLSFDSKDETIKQKYWIEYIKESENSYVAYDIGVME